MFQQDDLTINTKLFNSLPSDLQAILTAAADMLMWDRRMIEAMGNDVALAKMKAAGNQIMTLPQASVDTMTQAAKIVWDNLAGRSPAAYEAMATITDVLRSKGYTDYDIKTRTIKVKK